MNSGLSFSRPRRGCTQPRAANQDDAKERIRRGLSFGLACVTLTPRDEAASGVRRSRIDSPFRYRNNKNSDPRETLRGNTATATGHTKKSTTSLPSPTSMANPGRRSKQFPDPKLCHHLRVTATEVTVDRIGQQVQSPCGVAPRFRRRQNHRTSQACRRKKGRRASGTQLSISRLAVQHNWKGLGNEGEDDDRYRRSAAVIRTTFIG